MPADGTIVFAGPFRGHDGVVIIDHGGGWMSLLSGVATPIGARATGSARGEPLGRALGPICGRIVARTGGRFRRPSSQVHLNCCQMAARAAKYGRRTIRDSFDERLRQACFRPSPLVGALTLIPVTTSSLAAADADTTKELETFMGVFERVRANYVDQVDDHTLIKGAIDGMLAALDPHSAPMSKASDFSQLKTTTDGNYGGARPVGLDRGWRGQGHHPDRGHAGRPRRASRPATTSPTSTASCSTASTSTKRSRRCAASPARRSS